MVCGTNSDAGKSHFVTGLCRVLARRGARVAPFKSQNMSLNSYVTRSGHEIGRAQGVQAMAASVEAEVAMNPILLKPTGERTSQVVVMGRPLAHMNASRYQDEKSVLFGVVLQALEGLRARFDVVICEGAGSAAEINLSSHDLVNLRLASRAGLPALIVGDIDRGGVFASLYGTAVLQPPDHRRLIKGFVINKLRGDPGLLGDGPSEIERLCGVPTIGVLPWIHDVGIDAEDSLSLPGDTGPPHAAPAVLDVVAVRLPRIANFTDLDPLFAEPGLGVRLVSSPAGLGDPDLVIIPGSKATVSDLEWLRAGGLDRALAGCVSRGTTVLGVCAGYQMLGVRIKDDVESRRGEVTGLGWLDVETTFEPGKLTRQRRGFAMGQRVSGYEIRHGRPRVGGSSRQWLTLDDVYGTESEGAVDQRGAVVGTNLHGIFESDGFRSAWLSHVAERRGKRFGGSGVSFGSSRQTQIDRLADLVEGHVDLDALEEIISLGARATDTAAALAARPEHGGPAG